MTKRFEFLKNAKTMKLYDLCCEADRLVRIDAASSMMKVRQALEVMVRGFDEKKKNLFENLKNIEKRKVWDERHIDLAQQLRIMSNVAVHGGYCKQSEAAECVDLLHDFTKWYVVQLPCYISWKKTQEEERRRAEERRRMEAMRRRKEAEEKARLEDEKKKKHSNIAGWVGVTILGAVAAAAIGIFLDD
ncbi:DUF4145 domain-containing protein [Megasphaera elsdenii]|uniref:DUF4145 domain-containing protein n=1 Tax=Megasphaera elsdenii TaxID=907 RepID=UPI00195EEA75|nr:DUF4145 domain-containing protein [Megasphaera elsdenii]MBM6702240.1 DUF4145 domain-containing protein [Megasphaera elsdenii]